MEGVTDDFDFIRLGGRTFTITPVAVPSVDACIAQVKSVADRRVDAITSQLRREFVGEAFQLSGDELQRLVRTANQNTVVVPADKHYMPLTVINGAVRPVRAVLYAPNKYSGTIAGWTHWCHDAAFWTWVTEQAGANVLAESRENRAGHSLVITGTPSIKHSQVVLYTFKDYMYCTKFGFHTIGRSYVSDDQQVEWHKMCTGNVTAENYWRLPLPEFTALVNSVNLDSMATGTVRFGVTTHTVEQLCMKLSDVRVTFVRPTEEWRASDEPARRAG